MIATPELISNSHQLLETLEYLQNLLSELNLFIGFGNN